MSTQSKSRNKLLEESKQLPSLPGVYQMVDAQGATIYVGKARILKKRVASYFSKTDSHPPKVSAMVKVTDHFIITVTRNETEALILESNLIKDLRPRYNVLLRDDKSYPYIYADSKHPFPRLKFHRGKKNKYGKYFDYFYNSEQTQVGLESGISYYWFVTRFFNFLKKADNINYPLFL